MRLTAIAASAALVAAVNATGNSTGPVYTTEVVTAYTTYCPAPTQITHGGQTYTVTEATTLTITNCPCTVTKPISSAVVPSSSSPAAPVQPSTTPAAPVSPSAPAQSSAPVYSNSSSPAAPVPGSSSPAAPGHSAPASSPGSGNVPSASTGAASAGLPSRTNGSPVATFTGAANKAFTASSVGFAAVFGLAAYVL